MKTQHTPGPWRIEDGRIFAHEPSVAEEVLVCDLSPLTEFDEANARLIAAGSGGTMNNKAEDLIDAELKALERRKAKLERLRVLRNDVSELEWDRLINSQAKAIMQIVASEVCLKFNMDLGTLLSRSRGRSEKAKGNMRLSNWRKK
jgi:hypothetical protein